MAKITIGRPEDKMSGKFGEQGGEIYLPAPS